MAKIKTVELEGNQALALLIRQAMDESGLLGKDIAGLCDVKPQAVSNWKTTGRIEKQNLEKLADITGKPLSYFSTLKRSGKTGGAHAGAWRAEQHGVAEQPMPYQATKPRPATRGRKPTRETLDLAAKIQALPPHRRELLRQLLEELGREES